MKIFKYLLSACLILSLISVSGCSSETNESSSAEPSGEDVIYPVEIEYAKDTAASAYFKNDNKDQITAFIDMLDSCNYTAIDEPANGTWITSYQVKFIYDNESVSFSLDHGFEFVYHNERYYSIEGFDKELGNDFFSAVQ